MIHCYHWFFHSLGIIGCHNSWWQCWGKLHDIEVTFDCTPLLCDGEMTSDCTLLLCDSAMTGDSNLSLCDWEMTIDCSLSLCDSEITIGCSLFYWLFISREACIPPVSLMSIPALGCRIAILVLYITMIDWFVYITIIDWCCILQP